MKINLVMLFTTNALLWALFTFVTIDSGFLWWFFYLVCGSCVALWIIATDPYSLIGEQYPVRESIANYFIYVVAWLPFLLWSSHVALLTTLRLPREVLIAMAEEADSERG
jgi:hypothetical protein